MLTLLQVNRKIKYKSCLVQSMPRNVCLHKLVTLVFTQDRTGAVILVFLLLKMESSCQCENLGPTCWNIVPTFTNNCFIHKNKFAIN